MCIKINLKIIPKKEEHSKNQAYKKYIFQGYVYKTNQVLLSTYWFTSEYLWRTVLTQVDKLYQKKIKTLRLVWVKLKLHDKCQCLWEWNYYLKIIKYGLSYY